MPSTNLNVNTGAVALWLGCYTADMGGSGQGIAALRHEADGSYAQLGAATAIDSPSFLALHPRQPVLYAASEGAPLVHGLRIGDAGLLSSLGQAGKAGSLVCHVAVDTAGAFLVACCWGDGAVLVFELEADGSLGRQHQAPASVDRSGEGRQSRAHSSVMLGDGRFASAEMGHDLVRIWRFSAEGGLQPEGVVQLPHGCGPRHFARRSDGLVYVNTEYSAEVAVLAPSSETPGLELVGMVPASATGIEPDDAAAEICLGPDERHLYVGIRGSNRICRLALDPAGMPVAAGEFGCGGNWPRHHCVAGDRLIVALQLSDALAVFTLDADGGPAAPPQLLASGSPTCVLPHR